MKEAKGIIAEKLIEDAVKLGVEEVSILISNGKQSSIEVREGKLEFLESSEEISLSLSLFVNERFSVNKTSILEYGSLKEFLIKSVDITKKLNKDKYRKLPPPELYWNNNEHDLQIMDENYFHIEPDEKKEMVFKLEKETKSMDSNIVSVSSSYSDYYSEMIKVNSNGFFGKYRATSFSLGSEVVVKGENGSLPSDWYYSYTRFSEDIEDLNLIATNSVKSALDKIGQRKINSGNYDMVVSNRVSSKLINMILSAVNGSKLWNKSSFLDGKIGKKVFADILTIYDVPHIKRGLGSKEFDSDGFATKKRIIVQDGVLNYYLLNNYYAKKLDMKPTTGSTTNILLKKGNKSVDEMITSVNRGIYVKGFLGGNFNSSSGDFSFGINGVLVEKGVLTIPINEMNISGNAIELFNSLIEIGNDPYVHSSYRTPTLLFEKISFNGI